MNKYDKKAFQLETFIHERLPLKAKVREELRVRDKGLVENFLKDESKEFDGVVYYPKTKEVYCSFYHETKKMAVLIPVAVLMCENLKIQEEIDSFMDFRFS